MSDIKTSYQKFEELLEIKHLTPYRVAKELNFQPDTLYSWKKGEYEPKGRTMYKISKYLEVPISYFYD